MYEDAKLSDAVSEYAGTKGTKRQKMTEKSMHK
jgi:hypothetical protein